MKRVDAFGLTLNTCQKMYSLFHLYLSTEGVELRAIIYIHTPQIPTNEPTFYPLLRTDVRSKSFGADRNDALNIQ